MKMLDLFCGAGGCTKGYQMAGFYVRGVDIKPQPRYVGEEFVQADAIEYLKGIIESGEVEEFDVIHASPPCQRYCALKTMKNAGQHPDLVGITREFLEQTGKPWVMENVFGAPLVNPLMLCGSFFDLSSHGFQLRRHRYFESSFFMLDGHQCRHTDETLGVYGAKVRNIAQEKRHYAKDKKTRGGPVGVVLPQAWGFEAMGIDWMKIDELSEAIPPAYTEYIGNQIIAMLNP